MSDQLGEHLAVRQSKPTKAYWKQTISVCIMLCLKLVMVYSPVMSAALLQRNCFQRCRFSGACLHIGLLWA